MVVLARPAAIASLPSSWQGALDAGRMAVVSRATTTQRLTKRAANDRNDLAARLADKITVAHASAGGHLSGQCSRWRAEGLAVVPVA